MPYTKTKRELILMNTIQKLIKKRIDVVKLCQ